VSTAFEESQGVYVGSCTPDEVVHALANHSTGPVLIECATEFIDDPIHVVGYCAQLGDDDTPVFAFTEEGDVPLGCAVAYRKAFVLDLSWTGVKPLWTAERYTGGLDLRFPNAVVRLAFWSEIYHGTEDGNIAPGLGPFQVEPGTTE
jgi:hypothetical protein